MDFIDANQIRSKNIEIFSIHSSCKLSYIKMFQNERLRGKTGVFLFHNFQLTTEFT